jgi:hypothetical protein
MKLGKLLAAGKSVMSGHAGVAYRSSKQIYLPKFVSPKNPFHTPVVEHGSDVTAQAPGPAEMSPAPEEARKPAVEPRPTRAAPPEVSAPASVNNTVAAKTQKIPAFSATSKTSWASKFSPKSIFKAGAQSSPGAAEQKPAPMQAELSLDSVRVVHNDLTDVDVEIVPMKSRSASPDKKPAKTPWESLGERLFGAEAT